MNKIRDIAEDYYIRLGKKGRDIADMLGVTEQTIIAWKKGRDGERTWDERKRDMELTPLKIRELILQEAHKTLSGQKSELDADRLAKLMAAYDRLSKKTNPRTVMDVFMMFDNWMTDEEPDLVVKFTEYHRRFLFYIIERES